MSRDDSFSSLQMISGFAVKWFGGISRWCLRNEKGPEGGAFRTFHVEKAEEGLGRHRFAGLADGLADLIVDRLDAIRRGLDAQFGNPGCAGHEIIEAFLCRFALKFCELVQRLAAQGLSGVLGLLFNRVLGEGHACLENAFAILLIDRARFRHGFAGLAAEHARILRELVEGVFLGSHHTLHGVRG